MVCATSPLLSHPCPICFINLKTSLDVIATGNDKSITIFDYISKTVTLTVEGRSSNVSCAVYQPCYHYIHRFRGRDSRDHRLENGRGVVVNSLKRSRGKPPYSIDPPGNLLTSTLARNEVLYSHPLITWPAGPEGACHTSRYHTQAGRTEVCTRQYNRTSPQ